MIRTLRNLTVCVSVAILAPALSAQASDAARKLYPYRFTNFIWWSDSDLRLALKRKLPGLGDTLAPFSPMDAQVRLALIELLKTKGIHADVQIFGPSEQVTPPVNSTATGSRAATMVRPNAPQPSIDFTIAAPLEILVGDVSVEGAPPEMLASIQQVAQSLSRSPFGQYPHMTELRLHTLFQSSAYLSGTSTTIPGTFTQTAPDHYVVPCTIKIDPGPAYHVGSISLDPGPLFAGADPSKYIPEKPGDVVVPNAFNSLVTTLKNTYLRAGYADVDISADPVLDNQKALASYNIRVDPGPIYHLRTLTILNLDPAREQAVRDVLALKPGDPYNKLAPLYLFPKLRNNSLFAGYTYGYLPRADEKDHLVDVTFTFDVPHL